MARREPARTLRRVRALVVVCDPAAKEAAVVRWKMFKAERDKPREPVRVRRRGQLEISIPVSEGAKGRWVLAPPRLELALPLVPVGRLRGVDSISIPVKVVAVRAGKLAEVKRVLLPELRPVRMLKAVLVRLLLAPVAGDADARASR